MAIDMCSFAHYVRIPDGDFCTYSISNSIQSLVGCWLCLDAWEHGWCPCWLSGWCPCKQWKTHRSCKSKDYLSYQWALDPEALAEALGSSIADQAMGYPLVMTALWMLNSLYLSLLLRTKQHQQHQQQQQHIQTNEIKWADLPGIGWWGKLREIYI